MNLRIKCLFCIYVVMQWPIIRLWVAFPSINVNLKSYPKIKYEAIFRTNDETPILAIFSHWTCFCCLLSCWGENDAFPCVKPPRFLSQYRFLNADLKSSDKFTCIWLIINLLLHTLLYTHIRHGIEQMQKRKTFCVFFHLFFENPEAVVIEINLIFFKKKLESDFSYMFPQSTVIHSKKSFLLLVW